jgi:uncharacterized iron-regulated membrane protein
MNQRQLSILYDIHSWSGIVVGLLMFIVCFSGAVVVFKHEIDLWANPSLKSMPRVEKPAGLDAVLASAREKYPTHQVDNIIPPDETYPNYFVFLREGKDKRIKVAARADTGDVTGPVDSQLGQWIRTLHVFLFFGPRWIVGFLGVAMLVLIGTGIFIHTKIIKELYTQRWRRSFRLVMSDFHKVVGVWALAFHILIAFTGAWLGLEPVFTRAYEFVTTAPKPTAATSLTANAALSAAPASGKENRQKPTVPLMSVDALQLRAQQDIPGLEIQSVGIQHAGKPGPFVRFSGDLRDHLASTAHVQYSLIDGKQLKLHDPRQAGFWSQVNSLMEPLHFGDFGGIGLKWLYFFLGLTPALLSITGTLLWFDRRKKLAQETARSNAAIPLEPHRA